MYFIVSLVAALVGVVFAAAAAFVPDTGVDGTLGAFLVLFGTTGLLVAVGLLLVGSFSTPARRLLIGIATLTTIITGLAAWFLMQNEVLVAVAVSLLALVVASATMDRKATI
jgi:hypothetical protein